MRYYLMIIVSLLGCSTTQLQTPPKTEPTIIEQQLAEPLNYCQRGKYYRLIEYKHDMIFYLNSNDKDIAIQAAKNLQQVNEKLNQLLLKAQNKGCSLKRNQSDSAKNQITQNNNNY